MTTTPATRLSDRLLSTINEDPARTCERPTLRGESMATGAARLPSTAVVPRLVHAAIDLLATHGPSELKARAVAEAAGLSTTAVYYHIGGMPELLAEVVVEGFKQLESDFARLTHSEDPVADLMAMAIAYRARARDNPHLFDLMFGLSTRGSYRQLRSGSQGAQSEAFQGTYAHLVDASSRLAAGTRLHAGQDPDRVAAQLWSVVHGFVALELTDKLTAFSDPVVDVLLPLTVSVLAGFGEDPQRARESGVSGIRRASGG